LEHVFAKYNEKEIDLINLLLFIIESQNEIKDILDIEYIDSAIQINPINPIIMLDSNLHDLSAGMGLNKLDVKFINDIMVSIIKKELEVVFLTHPFVNKYSNDKIFVNKGTGIYSYLYSGKDNDYDKRVKIYFSSFLYNALNSNNNNGFELIDILYKFSEFGITSKYSQIFYKYLYSIDKSKILLSYDDLLSLFLFDVKKPIIDSFAKFKSNILNSVKNDINTKSDIKFDFKKVIKNNNVYVEFDIKKTTCNYKSKKMNSKTYFEMAGKYYLHKEIDKLIKEKEIKMDEREITIKKFLDDEKMFKTFINISKIHFILNNIKHLFPNDLEKILVFPYLDKKFNAKNITVANNYKLYSLSSGDFLTSNANDTYHYLKEAIHQSGKDNKPCLINNIYKNKITSISWTDG